MQTQFPFAPPAIDFTTSAFIGEMYSLDDAQRLVRMSRTEFFRFRSDNGIRTTVGRKVHGVDIVRALELARGRSGGDSLPPLREYVTKLMRRSEVCAHFGFKLTSLYKMRVRHRVPLLPGGTFHGDDIIASIEAERLGGHRLAGEENFRVMTRVRKSRKKPKSVSALTSLAT